MKCYRRMLRIPWTAKKSNEKVLEEAQATRELLHCVKKRKLQYFGHVCRLENSLEKDILLGMTSGKRRQGRPRISSMSNIVSWTKMTIMDAYRKAQDRKEWQRTIYAIAQHLEDDKSR